jgi:hypothetical protein
MCLHPIAQGDGYGSLQKQFIELPTNYKSSAKVGVGKIIDLLLQICSNLLSASLK